MTAQIPAAGIAAIRKGAQGLPRTPLAHLPTPLEEMKAQYPKPDPPLRPGCSLW